MTHTQSTLVGDHARLQQLTAQFLQWPDESISVQPLPGDASNRRYFRIRAAQRSAILMQLAEPEAFKASEEAVSRASIPTTELPFLNIWRHLHARGLPVPMLHHYDQPSGWLLLQDLGDHLLSRAAHQQPLERLRELYRPAIAALVRVQTAASEPPAPECVAFGRAFDEELFMWEFDHFLEYGIEARQQRPLRPSQRRALQEAFRPIAAELAAQPRCFTHRDFHSRNLMLFQDRLWLLDFQDALQGPPHYDLASLLRDSYIVLPDALLDTLIDDYLTAREAAGRPIADAPAFRRLFDLASVQRNLKAAGRFVFIAVVKGNDRFLSAIPRTLGYVRANLLRHPELRPLSRLLAPLVPELGKAKGRQQAPRGNKR